MSSNILPYIAFGCSALMLGVLVYIWRRIQIEDRKEIEAMRAERKKFNG